MHKEYNKSTDKTESIDAKIHALMLDFCGMQKKHWAPNGSWWSYILLEWPTEITKMYHTDTA